jgi:uncharacterized protein (TIGR02145 family)
MLTRNLIRIFLLSIIGISLFRCKPEEIILTGKIKGLVTDAENSQPIQAASVKLIQSYVTTDSTNTGNDGIYLLKNITPGNYKIHASKFGYNASSTNIEVVEAKTEQVDVTLNGIPALKFSDTILKFELDTISQYLTISNIGKGILTYVFSPNQSWITVNPSSGNVSEETDTIRITIDKTDLLADTTYIGLIKIISDFGIDTIKVIVYGLILRYEDQNYILVKIGKQIWMAENLNVGKYIKTPEQQSDNGIIEKYCYSDNIANCNIYGGLYQWDEMMQYNPPDNKSIGTNQGICPDGWHIPTREEWEVLSIYIGSRSWGPAGGALKEIGFAHWKAPNTGATNKSGFTMLGAGDYVYWNGASIFENMGWWAEVWSSSSCINQEWCRLSFETWNQWADWVWWEISITNYVYPESFAASVRCIKDP